MKRGKADRIRRGGLGSRYLVEVTRGIRSTPQEIRKKVETVGGGRFGGPVRCSESDRTGNRSHGKDHSECGGETRVGESPLPGVPSRRPEFAHTNCRRAVDILLVDRTYLGLGAVIWAACGKDARYTPQLLLDRTNRHSRFQPDDLKSERLVRPVDLVMLKQNWLTARDRAERLFRQLPAEELGVLYLNAAHEPVVPDPDEAGFSQLRRHHGSVRGAWRRSPESLLRLWAQGFVTSYDDS